MEACSIYGLGLRVNVAIAGLRGLRVPRTIDVSMALGPMPPQLDGISSEDFYVSDEIGANGMPGMRASKLEDGAYYRIAYDDGTRVVIDAQGKGIWATGPRTATVEDTATYLLGPALGFLLRLRGVTCLHASAVAIGGEAVAFVGAAGAGKSSTAAAFARLGYPVLTDDVAALVDRGDAFRIQPAYPRLRLWPDSVAAMFGDADALPRITPGWDKRYLDLSGPTYRFQAEPLPLAAIYILGERGAAARCDGVEPKTGLMSLVSETYTTRLIDRSLRAKEFEVLGRLVENVPLRRLTVSRDLRRIAELCAVVVDDLHALGHREIARHG
jgi:hypothetical protein